MSRSTWCGMFHILLSTICRNDGSWQLATTNSSNEQTLTLNPFTTGNPLLGTKLLRRSIWRGSGAPKGLTFNIWNIHTAQRQEIWGAGVLHFCVFHMGRKLMSDACHHQNRGTAVRNGRPLTQTCFMFVFRIQPSVLLILFGIIVFFIPFFFSFLSPARPLCRCLAVRSGFT